MRIIGILLLVLVAAGCQTDTEPEKQPNFIIFFSDELAFENVGAYGGDVPTPTIDKLAESGLQFDAAYVAAPMCTPSRFSLLTGKYPGRCVHPEFRGDFPVDQPYNIAWNTYLDGRLPTVPGILSDHGYFTGMAGKWHIGKIPDDIQVPDFPDGVSADDPDLQPLLARFQEIVKDEVRRSAGFDEAESVLWGNFDVFPVESLRYHNFPWITYGAIKLLEKAKESEKPFFLYLATTALHGPSHTDAFNHDLRNTLEGRVDEVLEYALPADSMKNIFKTLPPHQSGRYAGLACLDNHIKNVMRRLRELDLDKNTIVLFMADHNKEPGKATCYEKGIHVPFIINWPGKFKDGSHVDQLVSSVDILPTLLEIAGIPLPEGSTFDGISFLPVLNGSASATRDFVYAESGLTRAITDGKWKYIAFRYPEESLNKMESGEIDYAPNFLNMERQAHSSIAMEHFPGYFDADQLYNLSEDPYEQRNLAYDPAYRDELARLQKVLANYLSTFDHAFNLGDTSFVRTDEYRKLVEKSRSYGTDYIPWLRRDHGSIQWPPEN